MILSRSMCAPVVLGSLAVLLAGPVARAQISENVIFHANLDEHAQYNDIWGYTAPNGDEYALLGTTTGLSVINVVDPQNPYETGFIPGPTSTWRDIKTYDHYAYVTNESSGGLMIVNLADPESPVPLASYTGFSTAHNLYIDVPSARCFIAGWNVTGGVKILSLANPTSPVDVGGWNIDYFHDVVVSGNRLYGSAIYNDRLRILDISNLGSITILGTISGYPNAFTHNAWMTADDQYVMTTDETSGAACRLWDVSNLPSFSQTDLYQPNSITIPHNTHIEGDLAFISYYTLGVRVVDISDPFDIQEVGYYDTYPANDGDSYNGCWGVYPFFQTSPNLMVAADIQTGLWVLEFQGVLGTLAGEVTRTGDPAVKIEGAALEVTQTGVTATTDALGQYVLQDVAGSVTVEVSKFGYVTKVVPATIVEGITTPLDVTLDFAPGGRVSGTVVDGTNGLPVPGAMVAVLGTPLAVTSDGSGNYDHENIPVGTYTIRVSAFGFNHAEAAIDVTDGSNLALDFPLNPALVAHDFESDPGWTVSGPASAGIWERDDPQPTNGGQTQTGDDHTPAPGVNAWITGPLAGSSVGTHDVDGGATILTTPSFDLTGLTAPRASYWRWYVTGYSTNPTTDFWVVEVSSNGGGSWTAIENTDQPTPAWLNVDVLLSDHVSPPFDQIRFRFTAQDTGAGSITEGGVDDFMIFQTDPVSSGTSIPSYWPTGRELSLSANTPNPFRAGTVTAMTFSIPSSGRVTARVFDVAGRRVTTLIDGVLPAGTHPLQWSGRGDDGRLRSAGVYFVKLRSDLGHRSRKLLLIR